MTEPNEKISRVVLVDDHPIVRDGLCQMIARDPGLMVCGEAGSTAEALVLIAKDIPDLVMVDVFLDGINGIELTKMLTEKHPGIRILILSMHDENLYAERALRAGAMGYVMKQAPSREILAAMHRVLAGHRYVSASLRDILEESKYGKEELAGSRQVENRLSSRELSIFRALGEGLDRTAIAALLDISIKTVETHRANIKNKLHIGRSVDLSEIAKSWLAKTGNRADGESL
ncbi:MAG: response regulator [Kiritimatiellia bacterium]